MKWQLIADNLINLDNVKYIAKHEENDQSFIRMILSENWCLDLSFKNKLDRDATFQEVVDELKGTQ